MAEDIREKFYAKYLEGIIGTMAGLPVASLAIVFKTEDGSITTSYCEADSFDKAMFAHLIQSDAMWDELEANAGLIREMVDEAEGYDEDDVDDEEE